MTLLHIIMTWVCWRFKISFRKVKMRPLQNRYFEGIWWEHIWFYLNNLAMQFIFQFLKSFDWEVNFEICGIEWELGNYHVKTWNLVGAIILWMFTTHHSLKNDELIPSFIKKLLSFQFWMKMDNDESNYIMGCWISIKEIHIVSTYT